jgi:hypothetical protein
MALVRTFIKKIEPKLCGRSPHHFHPKEANIYNGLEILTRREGGMSYMIFY